MNLFTDAAITMMIGVIKHVRLQITIDANRDYVK